MERNKIHDKCNQTRCLSTFYKQLIPSLVEICKLFSCGSKPIHALLASKRRPIDLQKVPFKTLTNALLKSNQAPFALLLYNYLNYCWLQVCFSYVFLPLFIDVLFEII